MCIADFLNIVMLPDFMNLVEPQDGTMFESDDAEEDLEVEP